MKVVTASIVLLSSILVGACTLTPKSPPCTPEIKIVKVPYPYPVLVKIQMLDPADLPAVPPWLSDDATDDEKKLRAIEVGEAREKREAILLKQDEAWRLKVREHNSQEVDVPPDNPP